MTSPEQDWDDARVRALRPRKPLVDPWHPLGTLDDQERQAKGPHRRARTIFLAGAECPFACVFCDLWQYTTDAPTPPGAIPRQLESALADLQLDPPVRSPEVLKLYNASNFFDRRAVPREDHAAIARRANVAPRVVVECHPRLVGAQCAEFSARLDGELEIALGLETAHGEALARLNKGMGLDDFQRAVEFCTDSGIATRAFVLIGVPYVAAEAQLQWISRSIEYALSAGVERVSLIPVRPGAGALDRLAGSGEFATPSGALIEQAFRAGLSLQTSATVVSLDLWDLEQTLTCSACRDERAARLRHMEHSGCAGPPSPCAECESA